MKRHLFLSLIFVSQLCLSQAAKAPATGEKVERAAAPEKQERPEKDSLDFLDKIDYPELQVVPRASERLESEAQYEREGGSWFNQWSFLLSGATTLLASTVTSTSMPANPPVEQTNGVRLAQIVGAMSLGVGVYYGVTRPYDTALDKVRKVKGKDKRSLLLKERISEESLERTASMIGSITTISIAANFIVNANLAGYGDTNSKTYAYAALFVSTLAMMFPSPYVTNWEKHKEYKHKIYTPLPQVSFLPDPNSGKLVTYMGLNWSW